MWATWKSRRQWPGPARCVPAAGSSGLHGRPGEAKLHIWGGFSHHGLFRRLPPNIFLPCAWYNDEKPQPRCFWLLRARRAISREESEELMLEFAAHVPAWRQLSHSELRRHRLLRLNPLWFLCILGCACCILLGHGFHSVFCQGGAVRADEFEALNPKP